MKYYIPFLIAISFLLFTPHTVFAADHLVAENVCLGTSDEKITSLSVSGANVGDVWGAGPLKIYSDGGAGCASPTCAVLGGPPCMVGTYTITGTTTDGQSKILGSYASTSEEAPCTTPVAELCQKLHKVCNCYNFKITPAGNTKADLKQGLLTITY